MNELSVIASAVATTLSGGSYTLTPTVKRVYVPHYADNETDLVVFVAGSHETPDLFAKNTTRTVCEHEYTISVGIVKRVAAADRTSVAALGELDGLSDFREEVIDLLKSNRTVGNATLWSIQNSPVYDPGQLDDVGVFTSVITLVYRLLR